MFDVVIVGGVPAGLSAALVLGRCRRTVLVCDAGTPRNARSRALHGYLTRDGTPPVELLRLGREELKQYGIEPRPITVRDVRHVGDAFDVALDSGEHVRSRTVLLATGVRDELPRVPGIEVCYGTSVHHCPYCDGWEMRDKTVAALGELKSPAGLALSLKTWTDRVIAFTNGRSRGRAAQALQLSAHGIPVHSSRIARIEHDNGWMSRVVMANGASIACEAMFFTATQRQQCAVAARLGCEVTRRGPGKPDDLGHT